MSPMRLKFCAAPDDLFYTRSSSIFSDENSSIFSDEFPFLATKFPFLATPSIEAENCVQQSWPVSAFLRKILPSGNARRQAFPGKAPGSPGCPSGMMPDGIFRTYSPKSFSRVSSTLLVFW